MNRLQKDLLLRGFDFPGYVKISETTELYFNEEEYFLVHSYIKEEIKRFSQKNLTLSSCALVDISFLKDLPCSIINDLTLCYNKIENIKIFKELKFSNLERLDLGLNSIEDVSPLEELKDLRTLYLHANPIKDISPFNNFKSENLETLWLQNALYRLENNRSIFMSKFPNLKSLRL